MHYHLNELSEFINFLYWFYTIISESHLYQRHMKPRKAKYKRLMAEIGLLNPNLKLFKINCQLSGVRSLLCYLLVTLEK